VSNNYKLTGANGDSITFDRQNYILNPSLIGLGIPPTAVRIDDNVRGGGVHRYTRRTVRNVDLPITVVGTSATDVETKIRRLAKLTQDTSGPTVLTAIRTAGDLNLTVHYTGGAELEYGGEAGGQTWAKLLLSFQAPNPYWQSATTQSFSVTAGNTGRGLLPQLTKLRVSSSQALGLINVTNNSDVPIYPTFEIVGPVEELEVTLNGQGWKFTEPVATGNIFTVDHENATVTGIGGVNRYDILDTTPKFFAFPPGVSSVLVTGTNADLNTNITCEYNLAFEVVHG
jgi:hypothetical protein